MAKFFSEVVKILTEYHGFLLRGVGYTMLIALTGTIIGLAIGLITGIVRTIPKSKIRLSGFF